MTGVSSLTSVRLASAEEPILPALLMVVVPPAPLRASSAMPVRFSRLAPSKAPVPLITPVALLLMLRMLPVPVLPISTAEDWMLSSPSNVGSMVPELFRVLLLPASDSEVPPTPSKVPRLAPGLTLTVRPLPPLV